MTDLFTPEEQVEKENKYYRKKREVIEFLKKENFTNKLTINDNIGSVTKFYRSDDGKVASIWIQFIDSKYYHDTPNGVEPTGDGNITCFNIFVSTINMNHYFGRQYEDRRFNFLEYLKKLEPIAQDFERYKKWINKWINQD